MYDDDEEDDATCRR